MSDLEPQDDAGFTLVELMIAMAVMTVIGAITTGMMISGMNGTKQTQSRISASQEVQRELERIARDLRVADPVRAASASSIVVDLYRGGTCVRRTYALASGTITSSSSTFASWGACSVYPATATPTSTAPNVPLLRDVPAGTTFLSYRGAGGQSLGASPVLNQVRNITVNLATTVPGASGAISLSTNVGVRNATLR